MTSFFVFILFSLCLSDLFTLTINCNYPDSELQSGDKIFIRGDKLNLNWNSGQEMEKISDNKWSYQISSSESFLDVSPIQLKVLVNDEVWQIGSNEILVFKNEKSNYNVDIYPFFKSQSGNTETLTDFYSPVLNNTRNVDMYLPPSFYENQLKPIENILVMHDGQNLFNQETSFSVPWYCQNTLNELIVEGTIPEVMIIGIWNTDERDNEYTYSYDKSQGEGGEGDKYLDFIENVVLGQVQKHYSSDHQIKIKRESLGILGSSLGGLISCYAGYTRSNIYGKVGCMSSSFWWNNVDFKNVIMAKDPLPDPSTMFYLDTGTVNDCYNSTMIVKAVLENTPQFVKNENYFFYLDEGATHNEYYWGKRFHFPMTDLFPVKGKEL